MRLDRAWRCPWLPLLAFGVALAPATHALEHEPPAPAPRAMAVDAAEAQLFRQRIAEAQALLRAERTARADTMFTSITADPRFAALAAGERRAVLSAAAWAAVKNDRYEDALALYQRTIDLQSEDPDDWYRLSTVAFDLGRLDASAIALTGLIEQWPELLGNLDTSLINQLVNRTERTSPARLGLLQALFDANWDGTGMGASYIWYNLALLRIERGEDELARAAARRVSGPDQLIAMRSDRRFDTLLDQASWRANVSLAATRQVERLEQHASAHPDQLAPRVQLGYALLTVGRNDAVIALADDAVAAIAAAVEGAPPFTDVDQQVWLMNNRAIALRRQGLVDAAVEELRRATRLGESGEVNVSQALNLGQFHCKLGQADAALAAIATAGNMSGYGRMVQTRVRHCAELQKGNAAAAAEAMDYLAEHRKDSQILYLEGLVAAERLEDAARLVAELLASPFDRDDVLSWVQEYRTVAALPGEVRFRAARGELLARSDVRAAVERVGRIERHDVYGDHDM